jgi:hypothetical protein
MKLSSERRQVDPGGVKEFVRIDRSGMGGIEDDRRPPLGRLDDLERRRQFTIKPGHRGAPFVVRPLGLPRRG